MPTTLRSVLPDLCKFGLIYLLIKYQLNFRLKMLITRLHSQFQKFVNLFPLSKAWSKVFYQPGCESGKITGEVSVLSAGHHSSIEAPTYNTFSPALLLHLASPLTAVYATPGPTVRPSQCAASASPWASQHSLSQRTPTSKLLFVSHSYCYSHVSCH